MIRTLQIDILVHVSCGRYIRSIHLRIKSEVHINTVERRIYESIISAMTSTETGDVHVAKIDLKRHSVTLTIPMQNEAHAEIIRGSLQADPEPERSRCTKTIDVTDSCLRVQITGEDTKNLRNATTNFFELFDLVLRTIDQFGDEK